jgi:hypothetical protein
VKVEGAELPEEVFVVLNGNSYKMQKTDKLHFSYTFTNVQKDLFVPDAGRPVLF